MIQIREKPTDDLAGWESYITAKAEAKDFSFMPRNAAIVLLASESRAEAAAEERLGRVEAEIARLLDGQQRNSQLLKDLLAASRHADVDRRPTFGKQRSTTQLGANDEQKEHTPR